jgi:hypothetical protein
MAALSKVEHRDYPGYNPDQKIEFNGYTLAYTGSRCPLWQDGLGKLIAQALAVTYNNDRRLTEQEEIAVRKAPVKFYETTDKRLRWYETLNDYMRRRESSIEVVFSYVTKNHKPYTTWRHYQALKSVLAAMEMSEAKRCASFDPAIRIAARALEFEKKQQMSLE